MICVWSRIACGVALAVAGCSGRSAPPAIVIGHVASLSGAGKDAGEQQARGIRLAVQEVNKGDSLKVTALHTDAHNQLDAFEAEAVRLVAVNRVAALIGGTTGEEVERLDRARTVVIGLTGVRSRSMSELVFLTGLAPEAQGRLLAQVAAQSESPAALAAVGAGPLAAAVTLSFAQAGPAALTILLDERREEYVQVADAFSRQWAASTGSSAPVPLRYGKDADWTALAKRVKDAQARAVLLVGSAESVRQLRSQLPGLPIFFGGGEEDLPALRRHAETQNGVYLVTTFVPDTPRAKSFVKHYQAVFHEEPGAAAALAYEAAGLLFEALGQTETPYAKADLARQLAALSAYPGLAGSVSVGADRVVRRPLFVIRLENGRSIMVKRQDPPAQ
jgi:ABC-type branched-subunit amino acid transport system substrate-binding protein